MRERLAAHRENPACAACHRIMDPVGLALENFDPIGAWRTRDAGEPIYPSEMLFDGTAVRGPADIRRWIERHAESFTINLARNLLTFALGRILEPSDMPAVRGVVGEAEAADHRFSAYVMGIVTSTPFTKRRADDGVATAGVQP